MNPNDIHLLAKLSDGNVCLSGGAKGADALWGEEAAKLGHQVIHWSFDGHKSYGTPEQTVCLDESILKEADIHLEEAKLSLKRSIPYGKPWIANLLRRNWFQVQHAASVYAVGSLNEHAVIYKDPYAAVERFRIGPDKKHNRMGVNGGTAWACQMYLDQYLEKDMEDGLTDEEWEFNLVLYEQNTREYLRFNPHTSAWHRPLDPRIPPKGIYAAIGSRDLLPNGEEFIRSLMNASST